MFGSSLSAIAHWTARVISCISIHILGLRLGLGLETAYPSLSLGFNHRVSLAFVFRPNQTSFGK